MAFNRRQINRLLGILDSVKGIEMWLILKALRERENELKKGMIVPQGAICF